MLQKLVCQARRHFKNLPEQFGLSYTDAEGDLIDVICEDDYNTFKEQNKAAEGTV